MEPHNFQLLPMFSTWVHVEFFGDQPLGDSPNPSRLSTFQNCLVRIISIMWQKLVIQAQENPFFVFGDDEWCNVFPTTILFYRQYTDGREAKDSGSLPPEKVRAPPEFRFIVSNVLLEFAENFSKPSWSRSRQGAALRLVGRRLDGRLDLGERIICPFPRICDN